MEFYQKVHWYVTQRCNLDCLYCFAPNFPDDEQNLEKLAHTLTENDIKHVTLTGGEPTLLKNLDAILNILKDANINISLHTNGTTLTKKRVKEFKGLIDDIALPIDSTSKKTQKKLRGVNHLRRLKSLIEETQKQDISLVYHTVTTAINLKDIPLIYQHIKDTNFLSWQIYEFNSPFVREKLFTPPIHVNEYEKRVKNIEMLTGPCSYEKGGIDSLLAKFLLLEEQMKNSFNDPRINFVGARDIKPPYAFLDNSGDMHFCTWFSQHREKLGNLFRDKFSEIRKKLTEAYEQGPFFNEEDFIEAEQDRPFFARLRDGFFISEETEMIDPEHWDQIERLSQLYEARKSVNS